MPLKNEVSMYTKTVSNTREINCEYKDTSTEDSAKQLQNVICFFDIYTIQSFPVYFRWIYNNIS